MRRDEDSFVYKSYGSGYFGDFEHYLTIKVTTGQLYAVLGLWALTDSPASLQDLANGSLRLYAYRNKVSPVEYYLTLGEVGVSGDYWNGLTAGTIYYLTIKRDGTTLTCKIYSDSDRTDLLDTLTATCGTQTLEYLQCGFSREADGTYGTNTISGYCENIALAPFILSGVTRDSAGNALGGCTVYLFRSSDKKFVANTTSDGSGNYSFKVGNPTTEYFIRAHKDGTPNVFGTTDDDLTGS